MDLAKLIDMVDRNALFFTRSDLFEDKFEGSNPQPDVVEREALFTEQSNGDQRGSEYISAFYQRSRKNTYINCWHINDFESAAMWKIYAANNNSIATQSTIRRLYKSIDEKLQYIYIAPVKYIDFEKRNTDLEDPISYNALYPYFHKRAFFEYEHEERAVFQVFSLSAHSS